MKLTKIWLFLVALFATVCLLGCPGDVSGEEEEEGPGGGGKKTWVKPVYDPSTDTTVYFDKAVFDAEKVNTVAFFDFEESSWKTKDYAPAGDGATLDYAEGEGILGSNCIRVSQNESYGQLMIKAQAAYSKGKTYYFEAWFRDDTEYKINGGFSTASISITVYDQDIVNIAKANGAEYYDYDSGQSWYDKDQPDPYSISATDEISREAEEMDFTEALRPILAESADEEPSELLLSEVISYDSWTRLNGMVYSTDIDHIVGAKTPEDLVGFFLNFYCGSYPNQQGYEFYVDNIRFLDLNPEIESGLGKHYDPPTIGYENENNIVINIFDYIYGDQETFDVTFASTGEVAKYEITEGALPEGLTLAEDGTISGTLPSNLVEKDGEPKEYSVKIKAVNKGGEVEDTVTITIKNSEPVDETDPEEEEEVL